MSEGADPLMFDEVLARAVETAAGCQLFARPNVVSTVKWTCTVCGCTDDRACPGGCSWYRPNLCSRCA